MAGRLSLEVDSALLSNSVRAPHKSVTLRSQNVQFHVTIFEEKYSSFLKQPTIEWSNLFHSFESLTHIQ